MEGNRGMGRGYGRGQGRGGAARGQPVGGQRNVRDGRQAPPGFAPQAARNNGGSNTGAVPKTGNGSLRQSGGYAPDATEPYGRRGAAPNVQARPVYEKMSENIGAAMTGRGSVHHGAQGGGGGGGDGLSGTTQVVKEDSRGAVRGRRPITEVLVTRPKECHTKAGQSGKQVIVSTNYFRLLKRPDWTIYQYRIDFSPEIDDVRVRRGLLNEHREIFKGYIFDGTVLFSTVHLVPKMTNGLMELYSKTRDGATVLIKVKYTSLVDPADPQVLQVYNLILRNAMRGLNLEPVGRNLFDPQAKITLNEHRLEIWPGYQTSIRQHEQDLLLCGEIAHKVMRNDNLLSMFTRCMRENRDYQDTFRAMVCGKVVLTDYNNKTYRVDDVDFKSNPESTFPTKDGGTLSYIEYFKKRYSITIKDRRQPLLISRPKERDIRGGRDQLISLIPELTRATGLTDEMLNDFRLMKAMSDHTRLPPNRRIERLNAFNRRLQETPDSANTFKIWGLELDRRLVELPARVLPVETIKLGNNMNAEMDDRADWTNSFRKNSMYLQKNITNWSVITPQRCLREAQEFVLNCVRAAKGMRMNISEPEYHKMNDDRTNSYCQAIEEAASKDKQILMLVLSTNNAEKYSAIKKRTCVDRPIPSQVVTLRTIAPKKASGIMSVATKVVIQMNAKLMGAPWNILMPLPRVMIVGFDVCHSTKDKSKSYGALVSSMDLKENQQFHSSVMVHSKGQELSNEIATHMTYALREYRQRHGRLPDRILFYRDGVGDGQLAQVYGTEVQAIKQKLDETYKSAGIDTYKMAFIVVSKRINTRFFVRNENPLPGTIVDDVVTLPERYDFFLVSQSVRQGTVSPTHYNVIYDNMGLSADKIQILTYKMTHMYYNISNTCRVPAVCQYAHKLAFLVAESLHRSPATQLDNQLYFL